MGFIKGGLLIIISILLFITLLLAGIFLTLSWSLKYENVQVELVSVAKELTDNKFDLIEGGFDLTEEMDEAQKFMEEHCLNETSYVFSGGGYTFVVPCDILEDIPETPGALVEQGIETIVEEVYYGEYDCGFLNCFGKTELPLFLVSEKAKNYWQEKFYFTLIAFAVLVVLIFFLVEHKQNTLIVVGPILMLSSLPLLTLEKIAGGLVGDIGISLVSVFIGKSSSVFWIMFILGLVVLGAGIALRFLHRDSIKRKFSKKDVQKLVKKK